MHLPIRSYETGAHSQRLTLGMDLSRAQLEALEVARNGGDLPLLLTWWAAIADVTGTVHHGNWLEPYEINQSSWIKVLGQLGYAKMSLLEVPLLDSLGPEFAAASGHLSKAKEAMLRGEYREAVGCCRDVIEALSLALGDRDEQLARLVGNTRELSKAERLRLLRQALKVLTHPARHADEVAAAIDWTRVDAVSVITMTAALMQELAAPGARAVPVAVS